MSLSTRYCAAQPFADFLRDARANGDWWHAVARES